MGLKALVEGKEMRASAWKPSLRGELG